MNCSCLHAWPDLLLRLRRGISAVLVKENCCPVMEFKILIFADAWPVLASHGSITCHCLSYVPQFPVAEEQEST